MAVKYIVDTTTSYRDVNGNCYHFARITSTKTKKSLVIKNLGGHSNASALLFRLNLANDWSEVYETQKWEHIREFQRMQKHATTEAVYEHEVTPKMVRALNRK